MKPDMFKDERQLHGILGKANMTSKLPVLFAEQLPSASQDKLKAMQHH